MVNHRRRGAGGAEETTTEDDEEMRSSGSDSGSGSDRRRLRRRLLHRRPLLAAGALLCFSILFAGRSSVLLITTTTNNNNNNAAAHAHVETTTSFAATTTAAQHSYSARVVHYYDENDGDVNAPPRPVGPPPGNNRNRNNGSNGGGGGKYSVSSRRKNGATTTRGRTTGSGGAVVAVDDSHHRHSTTANNNAGDSSAGGEDDGDDDDEDNEGCRPMHEWQSHSYTSCNQLQELDMVDRVRNDQFHLINCGGDRCAVRIRDNVDNDNANNDKDDGHQQEEGGMDLVLKVLKMSKPFSEYKMECARHDGMAMERMSSSPYVLTTYGYCGASQIIEYGSGGNVHDLVKRARLKEGTKTEEMDDGVAVKSYADTLEDPIDKLRVGLQLVTAVADLHDVGISHNDICCHQFIHVNGVYKLNDFHLSTFLRRNQRTQQVCLEERRIGYSWILIHSPEEIQNEVVDPVKADDYVIGNVLYYVLTSKWIMEDEPRGRTRRRERLLARGFRSFFPPHIAKSRHPADVAMRRAIQMCWTQEVQNRPSSRQVSDYLHAKLREILLNQGTTTTSSSAAAGASASVSKSEPVRVSSIPALPDDWDYGEQDFRRNFK